MQMNGRSVMEKTTGLPSFYAAVQADENVNNVTLRGERLVSVHLLNCCFP